MPVAPDARIEITPFDWVPEFAQGSSLAAARGCSPRTGSGAASNLIDLERFGSGAVLERFRVTN